MLSVAIGDEDDEDDEVGEDLELYKGLVKEIYAGSKEYKRKSKKCRNLSIQAPNVKKSKDTKPKTIVVKNGEKAPSDGYMSDSEHGSLDESESESKEEEESYVKNKIPHSFLVNEERVKPAGGQKQIEIEQGKEGIENMLRENNILQNDFTSSNNLGVGNGFFKFSEKSSFRSYNNSDRESDREFFNMFESSDQENGRRNSKYLYFAQQKGDDNNMSMSEKE